MAKKKKRFVENVVVSLDNELKTWLIEESRREDRPVGQLARILLKEAREMRETKQPVTAR